ncbi:Helix-loop-helix domain containing protein 2-like protein [Leptotrombidium deliense]|uniref:Helix-loop-helix domain containing protein 2-like protein n=1 Tax=Leptotrombidium deliense TaxID=299467 RepID=A0A443SUZ0_9ACAR|nr:Helix-loop-helix domain containing protein 2-like protein [Leptotrombidium deliense]
MADESVTAVGTTCEDIWKKFDDFLLTPPQSPPIKFDLVSDTLDDDFSLSVDALSVNGLNSECVNNHNADVLHDCMWSGLCNKEYLTAESTCNANCRKQRRETISLSASPFSLISCSFTDLYNTCNDVESEGRIDDDTQGDEQEEYDDLVSCETLEAGSVFASSNESLKNDHSYGSPENSPQTPKSLIFPKSKVKSREKATKQLRIDDTQTPPITVKFVKRQSLVSKCSIGSTDTSRRCKLSQSKRSTAAAAVLAQKYHSTSKRSVEQVIKSEASSLLAKPMPKSSKSMYPERRREHNDSERKRRDHLRNAFHFLRDQIPKLKEASKKPARIVILSEATSFVNSLKEKHQYLEKTKDEELRKRERLFKKLTQLQQKCDF